MNVVLKDAIIKMKDELGDNDEILQELASAVIFHVALDAIANGKPRVDFIYTEKLEDQGNKAPSQLHVNCEPHHLKRLKKEILKAGVKFPASGVKK